MRPAFTRSALPTFVLALFATLAAPVTAFALGPLSSFGSPGEGAGQLTIPMGLAVAPDGTAYVTDPASNRVVVFGSNGSFLFAFGHGVNPGGGDICTTASGCRPVPENDSAGAMSIPRGVAIGPEGNVFVSDEFNHRIDVFTPRGEFLRAFGKEVNPDPVAPNSDLCTAARGCVAGEASNSAGALESPAGLAFDGMGDLLVAGFGANRIDAFSVEGEFLFAFGKRVNASEFAVNRDICTIASGCQSGAGDGTAGTMGGPVDVELAADGRLVVSSVGANRIDVFTAGGAFLYAFGREVNPDPSASNPGLCTVLTNCRRGAEGAAAGAFAGPEAVAINGSNEIYVADFRSNRIDQFSLDGDFIRAFGTGVIDGGEAFQVCAFTCQKGSATSALGSVAGPLGVALDCRGALYVSSERNSRVERFGEPGTPPPPCTTSSWPAPLANKLKLGKLVLNRKRGTATLLVQVPGPGGVALKGKGLKTARRVAKVAGTVKLAIKPIGKAERKLTRIGALKLRAKVTFTPTGGAAVSQTAVLRLRLIR